jgi:predicted Zn-dependent protease
MMMHRILVFLLISCMVGTSLAYELPDLGDSSSAVFSHQDEKALGREIMMDIRSDKAYFDDPESQDFLTSVGNRLLAVSDDVNGQDFDFFLIQDASLNAFALPGGHIGVHTGLMMAADNESELASVLAHEISHVTQHHIARMIEAQSKNLPITLAAMAAAILAARSNPDAGMGAAMGAQAGMVQAQLDFTRENEREADRLGIARLLKSGYDPRAMISFFTKLQRYGRFYEGTAPAYLKTHPLTTERLAEIQDRLQSVPYRQVKDGPDFQLVRNRIAALVGTPREALLYFKGKTLDPKQPSDLPVLYGLAVAQWRSGDLKSAAATLASVRAVSPPNALFDSLGGQILHDAGNLPDAIALYQKSLIRYPNQRALNYGYIKSLIDNHQDQDALDFIGNRLLVSRSDYHLYNLQAQAYAHLDKQLLSHQALAESYLNQGNKEAALDQLVIASKSGDGDFYQKSSVEAQIREIKASLAANRGDKGRASERLRATEFLI